MRVCVLSDTHCQHRRLDVPAADLLIHAGDAGVDGTEAELTDFRDWFRALPHPNKVFVAGNHDDYLESNPQFMQGEGVEYLLDRAIRVNGLSIYGGPHRVVPRERLYGQGKKWKWSAFMIDETWAEHVWSDIPNGLDILVTHQPPWAIRDFEKDGHWGSQSLRRAVERARPSVHLFGHVHMQAGVSVTPSTVFINAAVCDRQYEPRPALRTFDWPVVV